MSTDELKLEAEDVELEDRASPFAALYAHWERSHWSPLALDFSTDTATFQAMSESEQHGFMWMFANRFHAEFNVARLLAPFLMAAPDWEMQVLLATQVADEHRHMQCILRIYEEVFGVRGGIEAARAIADEGLDPVSKTLLYDELERYTLPLLERQDEDTFLQAVVAYHLLGEGVVARTGQYLAADQYERYQGFPALVEGQRRVSRDEARHIGIGVSYVRRRMDADREHTTALMTEMMNRLFGIAAEMLDTANEGMSELVDSGYGVSPQRFYEVAMNLTQKRLQSVGFEG